PSKSVFEVFYANGCGLMHKELIDATPGLSWDFVMVYTYHYWWNVSDANAITFTQFAANDVATYFNAAGGTFIVPLQQAAGVSTNPNISGAGCGEGPLLRVPPNAMDQYNVWRNAGCLNTSRALFYYGWGTAPEDVNLQTPAILDAA